MQNGLEFEFYRVDILTVFIKFRVRVQLSKDTVQSNNQESIHFYLILHHKVSKKWFII